MIRSLLISLSAIALIAGCSVDTNEPEPTKSDDSTEAAKVPVVETDTITQQACPLPKKIPICTGGAVPVCTLGPAPCRTRTCFCNP